MFKNKPALNFIFKKYLLMFFIFILILFITLFIRSILHTESFNNMNTQIHDVKESDNKDEYIVKKPTISPIELTDEQLAEYAKVYKEPAVLFLRKALDAYRQGTYDDDMIAATAIKKDDLNGKPSGLDSFEEYHQSKFVVYQITNGIMGGLNIHILFVDKPDQMFTAWVYERAEGDFDLRGFWASPPEDQESFNSWTEYFRPLLENGELSV